MSMIVKDGPAMFMTIVFINLSQLNVKMNTLTPLLLLCFITQ